MSNIRGGAKPVNINLRLKNETTKAMTARIKREKKIFDNWYAEGQKWGSIKGRERLQAEIKELLNVSGYDDFIGGEY